MSPKQKLVTTVWCSITMVVTMVLSHGHLIMREIMSNWPQADTWEGRLENAMYTQGGLVLLASAVIGLSLLIRGYLLKLKDTEMARKELSQRERHERAAEKRHQALIDTLDTLAGNNTNDRDKHGANGSKKQYASGARPR